MISTVASKTRQVKWQTNCVKDFAHSLDIKGFVKNRADGSPFRKDVLKPYYKKSFSKPKVSFKQIRASSLEGKIVFSKNVSQKHLPSKQRRLSNFGIKSTHHSVSLDRHLLNEKYEQIRTLIEKEQYAKAIPLIRHIIFHCEVSNAQRNLYYWLSLALLKTGKPKEALEKMLECSESYPDTFDSCLCLAKIYMELKNVGKGTEYFQTAIKIDPKNAFGYIEVASSLRLLGDHAKSAVFLREGAIKCPTSRQILISFVESLIMNEQPREVDENMQRLQALTGKRDSAFLYLRGLIEEKNENFAQACILFEEALKYNNSKSSVTKALLEVLKIEIQRRDYYKAHHYLIRSKFLDVEFTEEIELYATFVEGVISIMKKKFQEAIQLLLKASISSKAVEIGLLWLIYKYLGYGYFREGEHSKSVKFYRKVPQSERDQSSEYNLLLAEGIELVDKLGQFEEGNAKFEMAKSVYPQKIEPYLYRAMAVVRRANLAGNENQVCRKNAFKSALKQIQQGAVVNPNSSNLLYHRAIFHLYFEDYRQAEDDINKCIEKAEENLPKYFYLRGVCYSCFREFKKAINEFSICLSLCAEYAQAYLQKSKCCFLMGDTERGFGCLKIFMEKCPDDLSIYKWIGDLLYEGESYRDALKSYSELTGNTDLQAQVMKAKCLMRVGTLSQVEAIIISFPEDSRVAVDRRALSLLQSLVKNQDSRRLEIHMRELNALLELNQVGHVFQLIDCMNLLGVTAFYQGKYSQAYESFLLVVELFQSMEDKSSLKSEEANEELDLKILDVYLNLALCELVQARFKSAIKMLVEDCLPLIDDPKQEKSIKRLIATMEGNSTETVQVEQRNDKPINRRLKKLEIHVHNAKIICKMCFNMYHDSARDLYSSTVAQKMMGQFHASYIDNMPEGPWIRRNSHGVIFTQEILHTEYSLSLEPSVRESQFSEESIQVQSKHADMLKKLRFDSGVEAKLNLLMQRRAPQ